MKQAYFLLLFLIFGMCSCDKDNSTTKTTFGSGVYLLNQGMFGNGTSSISYFNTNTNTWNASIFEANNPGVVIPSIAQDLQFVGNKAFLTVNSANEIWVLDGQTFEKLSVITDIAQPRYMLVFGNFMYVSYWGANGFSGGVKKYNVSTLQKVATIQTGGAPERMHIEGSTLYVAQSNGYLQDNKLTLVDVATDDIIRTIPIADGVVDVKSDRNGRIVILAQGYLGSNMSLTFLDGTNILWQLEGPSDFVDNLVINKTYNQAYFRGSQNVFRVLLDSNSPTLEKIYTHSNASSSLYGMAYDATSETFYISDAKSFNSAGEMLALDKNGSITSIFATGVIPAEIRIR